MQRHLICCGKNFNDERATAVASATSWSSSSLDYRVCGRKRYCSIGRCIASSLNLLGGNWSNYQVLREYEATAAAVATGPGHRGCFSDAVRIKQDHQPAPSSLSPASQARVSAVVYTKKKDRKRGKRKQRRSGNRQQGAWRHYCFQSKKYWYYSQERDSKGGRSTPASWKQRRQRRRGGVSVPCHVLMRSEHPPRITGLPSRTETESVWNVLSQLQGNNRPTYTPHFICSSSGYYFIGDPRRESNTGSGCKHHIILKVLHGRWTHLVQTYNEKICIEIRHERICSTAFIVTQPKYASRYILHGIYRCYIYTSHITCWIPKGTIFKLSLQQDYEQVVQYELSDGGLYCEALLVKNSTKSSIPIDVLGNTAFNHFNYNKSRGVISFRLLQIKNKTTLCFDLLGSTIIKTNHFQKCPVSANSQICNEWTKSCESKETRRSRHKTKWLLDGTHTNKLNDLSLAAGDVWMEEAIRKRSTYKLQLPQSEKYKIDDFSRRKVHRKSYGLLFFLYLLASPLLCSTYPSTGIIASVSFVQKTSLVHADNITVHNLSPIARLRSSGSRITAHSHDEHSQNRKQVHPYNEYTWEVNQINPWLSACDLAGPAPTDLQGSCGPPEIPKYCQLSCSSSINADRIFHDVVERLVVPKKWRTGSAAKIQWKTVGKTVMGSTALDQCLFYLEESHKQDICRKDFAQSSLLSFSTSRENRYWFLSGLRLRHCCEHAVINALAPGDGGPLEDVLNGSPRCLNALEKILSVDALAARLHCEFEEVLARYDCRQSYSVIHNCTHCKVRITRYIYLQFKTDV